MFQSFTAQSSIFRIWVSIFSRCFGLYLDKAGLGTVNGVGMRLRAAFLAVVFSGIVQDNVGVAATDSIAPLGFNTGMKFVKLFFNQLPFS